MPLVIHRSDPDRFVLIDPSDPEVRIRFIGTGLTYGPDWFPVSGAIQNVRLIGVAADLGNGASALDRIVLHGADVATLNAGGFDWLASATATSGTWLCDPTLLLSLVPGAEQIGDVAMNGSDDADRMVVVGDGISQAWGHGGNDRIEAAGFMVHLYGGDGADTLIGGTAIQTGIYEGGAGNDLLRIRAGGTSTGSPVALAGGEGNDALIGGTPRAILYGGADDDLIVGTGNFFGGTGDDTMRGGDNGFNTFTSDGGTDHIFAGAGIEGFIFLADAGENGAATGRAIVHGFAPSEDIISLNQGDGLTQAEAFVLFQANARQAGDRVIFDDPSGYRVVLRDADLSALALGNFADDMMGAPLE